jgi:hypothetical protein
MAERLEQTRPHQWRDGNNGWTPLRFAVANHLGDIAELLRQHGGHE